MAYKIPPGPAGTSCLTCKRRHKKCDRGKPACDRCLKGGYDCLGYEHNKFKEYNTINEEPLLSDSSRTTDTGSFLSGSSASSSSPRSADSPGNEEPFTFDDTGATLDTQSGIECLVSPNVAHASQQIFDPLVRYGTDRMAHGDLSPAIFDSQVVGVEPPTLFHTAGTTITPQSVFPSDPLLFELATQIPESVPLPPGVRDTMEYVVSCIDRILGVTYFRPQGNQMARFRGDAAWRLSTSDFARQGMLIYAKVRHSILEGSDSGNAGHFIRWINGHEQALSARLDQSLTPYEHQERHHDILEIFYVKVSIFNATTTYQLMRQLVPEFLHVVYSDPTCWSTEHDPALVSVAHVFSSPRYGPAGFMLMDIIASMAYGVPHLVEYSTSVKFFLTELHIAEWMNCVPGECLILLAKINICRDQGQLAEDWQSIERLLTSWEPRVRFKPEELDSKRSVAWIALQEAWRQTLLIYLYLVLCGARTDDPRIQSSLKQIFRLTGAIRREDSPIANVHFFPQYLITGICSRTEKQRKIVRERLGSAVESSFWVFRGPDIIPVLDHLWLGAAIGGQPITWNDYIHSRHVMLPLSS